MIFGDSPRRAALDGGDMVERLVIPLRLIADHDPVASGEMP